MSGDLRAVLQGRQEQLAQPEKEVKSVGQNAMTEDYEHIELFEKPALFSNFRIDRSTVPDGWHCYDIRGSDDDPGDLSTVEFRVIVNHSGTILCPEEIAFPEKKNYRPINGDINFLGESVTVAEFCEQHHIPVSSPSVAMKQPQKKNRSNAYER